MRIAWDRGHGVGNDRGAVGFITEESAIDIISNFAIKKLRDLGHEVLEVRPHSCSSVGNSLALRCVKANDWNADIFISQHVNAGGGNGAECYTYKGEQLEECKRYLAYLNNHGVNNRGIKDGSDLAVINGTKMKSILLEPFFVDNQANVNHFNGFSEMFANAIVYGITGVDLGNTPTPDILYKVQVGVYGNKTNAIAMQNKLKGLGINSVIVK